MKWDRLQVGMLALTYALFLYDKWRQQVSKNEGSITFHPHSHNTQNRKSFFFFFLLFLFDKYKKEEKSESEKKKK